MKKAINLMIVGTMSDVGKSIITAALCRYFYKQGYRVAPFKSQNMALNSYITSDGKEMGRAQAMQAQAAGIEPDCRMNPVLLKPQSDIGSEVIVLGQTRSIMKAADYFEYKKQLIPEIMEVYHSLEEEYDIIIVEGAGSPAEINLRENDIVNMGLAEMIDAPVLLVGDIDRGGVFAQLYGTVSLLEETERARIKGLLINKFRGDIALLEPGLKQIEEKTDIPVVGVMPYIKMRLPAEDSLADILNKRTCEKDIDIAIIRLPHISNFTDFDPLMEHPSCDIRYVSDVSELKTPDLIIIPGTRSTIADLKWLRDSGLADEIIRMANVESKAADSKAYGKVVSRGPWMIGVCGGYQILGETISDPEGIEGTKTEVKGLGLLPIHTVFSKEKHRKQTTGRFTQGLLEGAVVSGYEIHHGESTGGEPAFISSDGVSDGCVYSNVMGTYLHGLFDDNTAVDLLAERLCRIKGVKCIDRGEESNGKRSNAYDILADTVAKDMDMEQISRIMGIE